MVTLRSSARRRAAPMLALLALAASLLAVSTPAPASASPVGTVTKFTDPYIGYPERIAAGPDGNLWFSNSVHNGTSSIARITPAGVVSAFAVGNGSPQGVAAGPDGNMWFTDVSAGKVGRVTMGGSVTTFTAPSINGPIGITAGPDGNLWFTNSWGSSIGRITTGGTVTNFTGAGIAAPNAITTGPDGALWFTNRGNDSIGRITTGGSVSNYTGTGLYRPVDIAAGSDGALWFTNEPGSLGAFVGSIGRISTAGSVSVFTAPSINYPYGIAPGPDGNLWFTDYNANTIGRITTGGQVTSFPDSTIKFPRGIAAGPDGAMWFANLGNSSIGRIVAVSVPGAPDAPWAAAGNGKVTVSWKAPAANGSPLTGYSVTAYQGGSPSGQSCVATPPATLCDVPGLTNGLAYTFTVTATNGVGPGPESPPSLPATPGPGSLFHPLASPTRILETRTEFGSLQYSTPWDAGATRELAVAGDGVPRPPGQPTPVPASATAVALNVTVTGTTDASFLTLWPAGATQPVASNLNWKAGQTIANAATVKVGTNGKIDVFNNAGRTHVVIDVVGYYDQSGTGSGFTAQVPKRILETRPEFGPLQYSTPWGAGMERSVQVAGGTTGVPDDAESVVLNATVTTVPPPYKAAESFLTLYPTGAPGGRPTASNLNWPAGTTIPNAVTVKVGTGKSIQVFNNAGDVNVILDVVGYFRTGSGDAFHPVDPVRFQDSRPVPSWNVGAYTTPWNAGTERTVSLTTAGAVPTGAGAVLANVTVTTTSAESFLTVWNTGAPSRPETSNLNWKSGGTIANAVTAKVGTDDRISVFNNSGNVDVIADAAGWYG